jgi:anti-sigma factor RsiW
MLITCRELYDFIDQFLARELPPDDRAAFEFHLLLCPCCVNYVKSYAETIRLGRLAGEPTLDPPPEDLVRAILASRNV